MKRLISFYGDDFTGSTDAMEALASHGLKTVLFTRQPTAEEFALFADCEAIGLAGSSRSQTPDWMDAHLPDAFGWLKSLGADHCHYKVCSTFDSSPKIGNIGRATEIGLRVFGQKQAALLIGVPQLKRYTFAGHLFAAYQGKVYRIDRHPVMSVHPVTPMDESDVLKHLAKQTSASVELLDVDDGATQLTAGERLLQQPGFVVGSSGVEYALMAALKKKSGALFQQVPDVAQMPIVSGSVSPTTERQIKFAVSNGFTLIEADLNELVDGRIENLLSKAKVVLSQGGSPIIASAMGPTTDQGERLNKSAGSRVRLSQSLGRIARTLVTEFKLKRLVIAGGDTSSHALGALNIHALTTRHPLPATPGSPLCIAYSTDAGFSGLEIALKGGQLGGDDYFVKLKTGQL